jgi:hypothetical protein
MARVDYKERPFAWRNLCRILRVREIRALYIVTGRFLFPTVKSRNVCGRAGNRGGGGN